MSRIAIVGASGFVGDALIAELLNNTSHQIIALSRSVRTSVDPARLEWRQCDLYSLLEIENGLRGADTAVYLVHSMLPSAQLVQGSFADYDLLLSDNFGRAARSQNIQHIVYLGGLIPEAMNLSLHLSSRLEVEENLRASKIPTTALRAGIVIGANGSSYRMMENLVRRLPLMLCPKWTATRSTPVALEDVLKAIVYCIDTKSVQSKTWDLGSGESVTYKEMMQLLARNLGLKRLFFPVAFFSPGLSKLWVSLITGAPRDLVYPLISSLRHRLETRSDQVLRIPNHHYLSFKEAIDNIGTSTRVHSRPHAYKYSGKLSNHEVQSVQRIVPRKPMSAKHVAQAYFWWLPRFFRPIIRVRESEGRVEFFFGLLKQPLLILEFSEARSSPDRRLYYVLGGLLARDGGKGRLEFRQVLHGHCTLAAIHSFRPSLPWYIYKYTQAIVHLYTMNSFKKFLSANKTEVM